MQNKGSLIVISGFSGAGKGTLVKKLLSDYDRFSLSISMTTRAPREGEENGREYFFVTKEEFEANIEKDGFLEHACYVGNYYGTPRAYVEQEIAKGRDVILEIEVQGATQIKKKFPEAILLFVTPPSIAELEKRLRGRQTENEETIKKRLTQAKEETKYIPDYDFILINDELAECEKRAIAFIDAAKAEPERNEKFIEGLRAELG